MYICSYWGCSICSKPYVSCPSKPFLPNVGGSQVSTMVPPRPAPTGFPRRGGGKNSAEAQPDGIAPRQRRHWESLGLETTGFLMLRNLGMVGNGWFFNGNMMKKLGIYYRIRLGTEHV